jgi:DMSO/TMAO reductase YedYZ heme-binding membrane subunit
MTFLRTLMHLALIVWLGGIVFFAAVLAPTVFRVLPNHEMAGNVVNPSLNLLHWIGLGAGLVFLICSLALSRMEFSHVKMLTAINILVLLMLALTATSQFSISPRMRDLRAQMGNIDTVATNDSRRLDFNRLHQWSTRSEAGVLLFGLVVVILMARKESH